MAKINPTSVEWRLVVAEIERRLVLQRASLEAPGIDATRTEFLRGAIAELKLLLRLPEDEAWPTGQK